MCCCSSLEPSLVFAHAHLHLSTQFIAHVGVVSKDAFQVSNRTMLQQPRRPIANKKASALFLADHQLVPAATINHTFEPNVDPHNGEAPFTSQHTSSVHHLQMVFAARKGSSSCSLPLGCATLSDLLKRLDSSVELPFLISRLTRSRYPTIIWKLSITVVINPH